jgi:flagellar motor component MotA
MLGIINTMSNLEDPEMIGKKVAAAMSGVVIAVLVSQGLFVYLRHTFAEKR